VAVRGRGTVSEANLAAFRERGHGYLVGSKPRRNPQLDAAGVGLSPETAMETLQTIRHVTFDIDGQTRSGVSSPSPQAHRVLQALGLRHRRPPDPPPTQSSVM
jgi:hypothetical protein